MNAYLCATVTFLGESFHGRGEGGEPEWPPSPLRMFQAIVCAAAYRWREALESYAGAPFRAFEEMPAPEIVAAPGREAQPYNLSVPNNAMDIVARAWAGGNESNSGDANPARHRTMKSIRPINLNRGSSVHYLWPLPEGETPQWVRVLAEAGDGVSTLGWGVDMVAACVRILPEAEANALAGERWQPVERGGAVTLRIPQSGTLADLAKRHSAFLRRIDQNHLTPVPPAHAFGLRGYRRDSDPVPRPWCAFKLLEPDASKNRSFDPVRHTAKVAGMMRHAVSEAAKSAGWSEEEIGLRVHGHVKEGGMARGGADLPRFAYLPVPSLETYDNGERVGRVLRVLVAAPPALAGEITWLRRSLSGAELIDEATKQPVALLSLIPDDEWTLKRYTRPASEWATVVPLILPGYDDGNEAKGEKLIRTALAQAGAARELAQLAEIEWRRVGFFAGLDLATHYDTAGVFKGRPRYHLRIGWRDAHGQPVRMPGPLAIGAGRYAGFGLLAPLG